MNDNPVEGELFSRNYLRPAKKLPDSIRARRRALAVFEVYSRLISDEFVARVKRTLGAHYPSGPYGPSHTRFWTESDVRDFLGAITLVFRLLQPSHGTAYLAEMRDILSQEGLHYRIDDKGGVHYLVDEEFSWVTESTIQGLGSQRFAGARHALEEGLKALTAGKLSGKALIRGVFEAAESTFLVLVADSKVNRLNETAVDKYLRPKLLARYEGVPDAEDKVARVLDTFSKWVKAAHPYRHGAAFEDVHEAPIDEAVLLASTGMAYIRYMVSGET